VRQRTTVLIANKMKSPLSSAPSGAAPSMPLLVISTYRAAEGLPG